MTPAAIETQGLHMHYGEGRAEVRALDGVDLTIEAGEMVAVMGPSGSGKSTLLHIVGALESPTSGTVAVGGLHYEGLDDRQLTELRRDHIGFVFQFSFHFPGPIVVAVAIASVVLGVLAAIWPARRAARLKVIEALVYE